MTPYPILTNCETTSLTARCPSTEIDDAWDVKVAAEEALAETVDDAFTAAKSQQILVDTAQEAVESAADEVIDTVNEIDIDALAASLAEKIELEKDAEAAVEDLTISVNQIDIDALAARLAEKIELEKDAETTLAELGVLDALQIKLATAAINQASANLDNARTELAAANLSAPFSGIISSISVAPGDQVSRSTPTIDILDPSVITVDGTVDEIDVLSLRLGNQVAVTLDALPDQVLAGVIDEIGDGVNQQGIVEFPLTIALTPPDSVELIEGLSATATIVLNQIDNALLVPLQAIGGSFTQPTVDVVTESGFITTEVTLGASDDFWVVIESGLTEGQEVLMTIAESVDPLEQLFGGGAIRIPGGAGRATFTGQQRGGGGGGGR